MHILHVYILRNIEEYPYFLIKFSLEQTFFPISSKCLKCWAAGSALCNGWNLFRTDTLMEFGQGTWDANSLLRLKRRLTMNWKDTYWASCYYLDPLSKQITSRRIGRKRHTHLPCSCTYGHSSTQNVRLSGPLTLAATNIPMLWH